MTKQEIVEQLRQFVNVEQTTEIQQQITKLGEEFSSLKEQTILAQKEAFTQNGNAEEEFTYKSEEVDASFDEVMSSLKTAEKNEEAVISEADEIKRKALELLGMSTSSTVTTQTSEVKQEVKEEANGQSKEESFAERQKIVQELEAITKTDVKNISQNFRTASDLQARWKATKHYNTPEFKELENKYKIDLDRFYASAQIVKDSIELDYSRNKTAKDKVVEKIKGLSTETDARSLEQKIRQYEKEWFRVGPVKKEIREESKKELETAVAGLQPLLTSLYDNQKELLADNLKKKINVCEQLNGVIGKEFKTPKQFQIASDKVIQLQKDWREIGRSDENDRIWEVFRAACDNFFNAKRDFFKNLADNRKVNKEAKLGLIAKAEEVKDSTDWNKTSDYLIKLQKEWKTIGPAHPAEDQKLWVRFRSACDVFFDARSESFKSRNNEQAENLKMKETLIQQLKDFKPGDNNKETINQLQEFEKQYNAIGFVPFKQKDKVHEEFYGTLNAFYDQMNIDRNEKAKMRFENRVKSMATGNNADRTLSFEERKVKERIQEVKKQLASYDQNISFIKGNDDNPLVKGIKKNIRDAERELESLQMQLTLLKDAKSGKLNLNEEE